jgi:hypothetical protein
MPLRRRWVGDAPKQVWQPHPDLDENVGIGMGMVYGNEPSPIRLRRIEAATREMEESHSIGGVSVVALGSAMVLGSVTAKMP